MDKLLDKNNVEFLKELLGAPGMFILFALVALLYSLQAISQIRKNNAETRKHLADAARTEAGLHIDKPPVGRPPRLVAMVVLATLSALAIVILLVLSAQTLARLNSLAVHVEGVTLPYNRGPSRDAAVPIHLPEWDTKSKNLRILGVWYSPSANIQQWMCVDNINLVHQDNSVLYKASGRPTPCERLSEEMKKQLVPTEVSVRVSILYIRR